jgi:hypothetical protein
MEMFPEKGPVLRPGMVNIVGETHSDSEPRRDLEKDFVRSVLGGGVGYWTETDFPDEQWQPPSMSRKPRAEKAKKGASAADLTEYRGAHVATALVGAFVDLCAAASAVGDRTDDKAGAAVAAFVGENLETFVAIKKRLKSSWKPTDPKTVPESGRDQFIKAEAAVQKTLDDIDSLLLSFIKSMRSARGLEGRLKALRTLGSGHDLAPVWLRPLSEAVGVSEKADPEKLEQQIQDERSRSMALGAIWSGKPGVYKVGNDHIKDLTTGGVKVDRSRVNIVSEEDFNREFKAWLERSLSEMKNERTDT